MKIGFTTPVALVAASMMLAGCYVDSGPGWSDVDDYAPDDQVYTTIEPGAEMEAHPGEGVGVFIEVNEEGMWHVFTTCDTALSDTGCNFRVIATVIHGRLLDDVIEDDLERNDNDWTDQDAYHALLDCMTYEGTDGMWFLTAPDDQVRFTVYLDGYLDPRFIYWVGHGAIHEGAPTDPIVLRPRRP